MILDPATGEEITQNKATGVLAIKSPWPSIARTVLGSHKRFMETYLDAYKGYYVCAQSFTNIQHEEKPGLS